MGIKFSPCELLELAINIEKNGKDFYFGLVGITDNAQVETVFRQLAKEEEEHIEAFQNISADSCDFSAAEVYTDDYFSYLRAVSDQYIFTQKDKGKELAESVKSCEEALDVGIRVECSEFQLLVVCSMEAQENPRHKRHLAMAWLGQAMASSRPGQTRQYFV